MFLNIDYLQTIFEANASPSLVEYRLHSYFTYTKRYFFHLINLMFKLRVGYHVGFKLIVCEGQKVPYVWGKTPTRAFCPISVRALCLTDGKNYSHYKTLYFVRS